MSLEELIIIGVALVIIGVVTAGRPLLFPFWRRRAWEKVADEFGFWCDESRYILEGERYEMFVEVRVEEMPQGSRTRRVTHYEVPLGGYGIPPMRLQPENKLLGVNLDKMLKQTELEVGYDALDDAFIINGEDKEAIAEFFRRPGASSALLRCLKWARGKVTYGKGRLQITHEGVASRQKLRHNIDAITRCAAALAKAGGEQLDARQQSREGAPGSSEKFGAW